MKRFASHYIYIPGHGFLKSYMVELDHEGYVYRLYPFEEEAESIIWTPGVIGLFPPQMPNEIKRGEVRTELPVDYRENVHSLQLHAVRFYPFDYTSMQPSREARIQLLGNADMY